MMDYENELEFIKKYFNAVHINTAEYSYLTFSRNETSSVGVYSFLYTREVIDRQITHLLSTLKPNTLYHVENDFHQNHYTFFLPNKKNTLFVIGPFFPREFTRGELEEIIEPYNLHKEKLDHILTVFETIPIIPDNSPLHTMITTFCNDMWGASENYEFENINMSGIVVGQDDSHTSEEENPTAQGTMQKMAILSERYEIENHLMAAISKGELQNAQMYFQQFLSIQAAQQRVSDPLRNMKNYTVILNTLYRKAAEAGKVHPIYIDALSSDMAKKIESCQSVREITALSNQMMRKYCFLVKNHSMQNFSKLIQQCLTIIGSDLSAKLSLKTLANELSVNPSYLSSQFNKEIGETLTSYVTKKRIEHAILLLNSTNHSIAEIAEMSGISDIQYFSKIFKKNVGHTPSEYRKLLK